MGLANININKAVSMSSFIDCEAIDLSQLRSQDIYLSIEYNDLALTRNSLLNTL